MKIRTLTALAGMALFIAPLGCAPKQAPPAEPEPDPMAVAVPEEPAVRIRELKSRADQLASFADQLPGRDEEEFRPLMSKGLEDLGQALRHARPVGTNGSFRVAVEEIFQTSRELRTRSLEYPLRPNTTSALRSAYLALLGVKQRSFPENAELQQQLDAQAAALRPLETDQGALYRLAATEAFRQAVKTLQQMADLYAARIPTEAPSTQVVTPATTAETPATSPAPAPAASEPAAPTPSVPPAIEPAPAPEPEPAPAPQPQPVPQPAPAQPELNK